MALTARSVVSLAVTSRDAGLDLGRRLTAELGQAPAAVVLYASVEHDQPALLAGVREAVGPDASLLGCSSQGLTGPGSTVERGYFAGALGLAGGVRAAMARVDQLQVDSGGKGRALGEALRRQVPAPRLVLVYFDPFSGADIGAFLAGLHAVLPVPIAGGAASQPWGRTFATYQYAGAEVFSLGAVALALDGDFEVELAASHGTAPLGLERTVTRAEGTRLLELDGERAADVWRDAIGTPGLGLAQMSALALGLPNQDRPELGTYRVLSPAVVNPDDGSIVLFTPVEPGTRVVLHHRTVDGVLEGTRRMAAEVAGRLQGRRLAAVLGFECGARTEPFLGQEATRTENRELQERIAPGVPWLGMMAWGEVLPLKAGPSIVNYTYPLVCLLS